MDFRSQVKKLTQDITTFKSENPAARPVFINLPPMFEYLDLSEWRSLSQLFAKADTALLPATHFVLLSSPKEPGTGTCVPPDPWLIPETVF
jgi:hypothetical protein